MSTLKITETVLRDGNQSLAATRMPLDEILPSLEDMNRVGYASIECWGGATFDACLRYLKEDPWERLRLFREAMPDAKLQMLMRGQCILGYKHYPDDVVIKFVEKACGNGIDIIRIFDALNNVENMKTAVRATLACGKEASCALSFSKSPIHHLKDYIDLAKKFVEIGASSICIKDMSGILSPKESYELIARMKDIFEVPVILHSHCTSRFAYLSYYEAIRAGVDVLDTCISPFSGGTSQPSTELIVAMASELGREVSLDEEALGRVNLHFKGVRERMEREGKINFKSTVANPNIIKSQIPGGMYSNLMSQLRDLGLEDKFEAVIREVPRVRKDMGYPPLVTPISQMIGVQAVTNIASKAPYAIIISEIRDYFKGNYGEPPGEVNLDLLEKITGKRSLSKRRYASTLDPIFEQTKASHRMGEVSLSDEDILILLLFPEIGERFLREKYKIERENHWGQCKNQIPHLEDIPDLVDDDERKERGEKVLCSSLPGNVVEVCIEKNEWVRAGQVLMIIETMKMENRIVSNIDGFISNTFVSPGMSILKGDPLLEYGMGS